MELHRDLNQSTNSQILPRPQREIQKCPQCESVFIDNNECESCGYQLGFDFLGDPLGEKSFYTIRENYWMDLGPIAKIHLDFESFDSKKFDRYKRKLLMRYNVLLDYFYNQKDYRLSERNLFLQEFTDLIIELVKYGVSDKELWQNVDDIHHGEELSILYTKIQDSIIEGKKEKEETTSFIFSLLNFKLFGLVRVGVIAVTFFVFVGLISASLSFYKYLLIDY